MHTSPLQNLLLSFVLLQQPLLLQLPYEQLRLLLEQRSSEVEVLRNRLEQREASLDALKKSHEAHVSPAHRLLTIQCVQLLQHTGHICGKLRATMMLPISYSMPLLYQLLGLKSYLRGTMHCVCRHTSRLQRSTGLLPHCQLHQRRMLTSQAASQRWLGWLRR